MMGNVKAPAATERRAGPISPVTIELRGEFYAAEFAPRLAQPSGVWDGNWKNNRAWRLEVAVHFSVVLPDWALVERALFVRDGTRRRAWVEYWEHWVLASSREQAVGCLVRDLRRDRLAEWITHVALYRVLPPLTAARRQEIERVNGRLLLERERVRVQAASAPGRGRQLEMAGV